MKSVSTCPIAHEVILSKTPGLGLARNNGVRKSSFPFLVFLDDDIQFDGQLWDVLFSTKPNTIVMAAVASRPCSRVLAIHKSDFWRIGGFNENIKLSGEDTDFQLRAEDQGFQILRIPDRLIQHKNHETRFRGLNSIRKEMETAYLFIKYGRRYGSYRRRFVSSNIKYLRAFQLKLLLIKFLAFTYNIIRQCFHL